MHALKFTTRTAGRITAGIDVSSYGRDPYRVLSPFAFSKSYQIPVPGKEELRSHSVEGIWQGLKVIDGDVDLSLLASKPRKRKGNVDGHLFGEEIIPLPEAREHIYVPAYTYHVVNNGLDLIKDDFLARLEKSTVEFYDVESNGNLKDVSRPYSHAALLTNLLEVLLPAPLPPFTRRRFTYLHEEVEAALNYRQSLDEQKRFLLDEVISFAYLFSQNELRATFALRAMKEGTISDRGRLQRYSPTIKTREPYEEMLRR